MTRTAGAVAPAGTRRCNEARRRLSTEAWRSRAGADHDRRHGRRHLDRRTGARSRAPRRHRPHLGRHGADRLRPALQHAASSRTSRSSTSTTSPTPTSRAMQFDLGHLAEATQMHVGRTMEAKRGDGLIFINCMEKLTMNTPRETLRVRLAGALDARHRRHHAVGRAAPGLVRADRRIIRAFATPSSASSCRRCARCSCSCARTPASTACPTTSSSRARWPAAISASAWTGRSTTSPPSSPRSATTCRRNSSTFR